MSPSSGVPKERIGEMLIRARLIDRDRLEEALAEQKVKGGRIVEILIDKGYLDIPAFVRFLAKEGKVPGIDILNYDVGPETIRLVPAAFARQHEVFPLDCLGNVLTIGMVCPIDSKALEALEELTQLRVRAFLCHKADLIAMINTHYRVEDHEEGAVAAPQPVAAPGPALSREADALAPSLRARYLVNMIRRIDALPSLPATARRCQEAMSNPDISPKELAQIVAMDPVEAANLLRVVNSAAFGLAHRVSSIAMAISLLGVRETCMIVLASTIPKLFVLPGWFDNVGFRRAALFCAAMCKAIAEGMGKRPSASFFTAGLLHDLGRAVLAMVTPYRYARIPKTLSDRERMAVEEETLGMSHAEAGYVLADNWGLPPELLEAIRFHGNPAAATQANDIVETVAFAVEMLDAHTYGPETIEAFVTRSAERVATFGLTTEMMIKIAQAATSTVDERIGFVDGAEASPQPAVRRGRDDKEDWP